ncbi:enoyl-CoA hydratase-related protein [Streptomyces luomodiensis]|uniref:Enoyl-CoA hydratase-related protein n=1 Tax=Streptomyces luomodiensis TaxID=3026192 RepID=A0ABY9UUS5_9ACTN|nr:enoyl-CoA hydratase-related protein [Streptomyces sp. SCA4-21]WNE94210.1 enoyl-CoA hydratase-related protein [Streptomyces sp. SCA4-21]
MADHPPAEHLRLDIADHVATLTIDRPAKRNAMTLGMWSSFPPLLRKAADDERVKVLIVRGTPHFSAGADIGEFGTVRSGAAGGRHYNEVVDAAETALASFPKPTIAAVSGYCIGGGCELAIACDLRIAARDARLAITPAKVGLVYTHQSTKALAQLVGPAWAKQILFTGEQLDAAQALRIGLVNEVVDDLDARVGELARTIAGRAQLTVRAAKTILRRIQDGADTEDEAVRALYDAGYESADYAEGVAAFAAKRQPRFS